MSVVMLSVLSVLMGMINIYAGLLSICIMVFLCLINTSYFSYNFNNFSLVEQPLGEMMILLTLILFLFSVVVVMKTMDKYMVFLCLIMQSVLIFTFKVSKILLFYFSFEATIIPMLLMILARGYSTERFAAATWMVVYTVAGSLPFLFLMLVNFSDMMIMISGSSEKTGVLFSLLCLLPFMVKFPLFGVHYWLPLAHVEAPLIGSMLLAGILLKLGGYGFMVVMTMFVLNKSFLSALCIWSLVGCLVVCMHIVSSSDIKKLIALSSVAHMNVSVVGLSLEYSSSVMSAKIMLVSHGLCSAFLFYLANSSYLASGSRAMMLMKGMLNLMPVFSLWLVLYCSVNMAAPPSLSFVSELLLCPSLVTSQPYSVMLFMVGLFMAVLYSMFLYYSVCHGSNNEWSNKTGDLKSVDHSLLFMSLSGLFLLILVVEVF